ncbi:MAG: cyclic nucleotide-binding domain-containing protein [Planctomycetota bacterium]
MIPLADLRRYSLFAALDDGALELIRPRLQPAAHPAGSAILEQGAHGDRVYFLVEGRVAIEVDGTELLELHAGQQFGEMHFFDIQTRSAAVIAREPTRTLSLDNRDLRALQQANPQAYFLLMMNCGRDISRRLRALNHKYVNLLRQMAAARTEPD